MRKFIFAFAIVATVLIVFFTGHIGFAPRVVAAASMPAPVPAPQGGPVISCNSNNNRRNFCPADTRGGVRLVNQRSNSPCIFNQTWGFDARNVWVDRGCRADFQASYYGPGIPSFPGYPPTGGSYSIYCSSDNGRRNFCPTDTSGGVSLARQRSNSPCVFGSSWGWDRRGVWVDRGCRADFTMGGNNWAPPNRPGVTVVSCSSDDMRRNNCNVNTSRGVRLIRQRSNSDCIYGQTWGYTRNFIWVDRGCRADFEVGNGR
jgi:Protein of unknown function (DUF3011)